jgi:sec-independent protein translocase protein TatC
MEKEEAFMGHLKELRYRLIVSIIWFILSFGIGLYFAPKVFLWIKGRSYNQDIHWNVFALTDGMFIYMKCAFLIAILLTLPVALYQLWRFAQPGLTERENKLALTFIPASALLFFIGACFAYYVAFPMMVRFMSEVNHSIGASEVYGIGRYFSFLFSVVFPLALAFEMPLIVVFLTKIGLLSPSMLKKSRKTAYLILVIIGSMISPPDFASHLSITIPLIVLFEISLMLNRWLHNKQKIRGK